MRPRILVAGSLVVAGVLAVSCGSSGDRPDTRAQSQETPSVNSAPLPPDEFGELLASSLPLDDSATDSGFSVVQQAQRLLLERCMSAKGFVYVAPADSPAPPRQERFGQYLGITDLANAMANGYHPSLEAKNDIERRQSQVAAQTNSPPSPEYLSALTGSTDPAAATVGGCVGQIDERLGGGRAVDAANLVGRLKEEATTGVLQSRAYKSTLGEWSNCMKEQGIDPPASPFDLIPMYGNTPVATPEEIRVATADVNCKSSSGLVASFIDEQRKAQAQLADRNSAALDEVRQAEERLLDVARRVLAGED